MTTVGYGDRAPSTGLGECVACLAMLSGIVLISLPVAIVGTNFQQAYEDRELLREERADAQAKIDAGKSPRMGALAFIRSASKDLTGPSAAGEGLSQVVPHEPSSPSVPLQQPSPAIAVNSQASPKAGTASQQTPLSDGTQSQRTEHVNQVATASPSARRTSVNSKASKVSNDAEMEENLIVNVRAKLKRLTDKPKLSKKAQSEVQLLLELFDHLERAETRLAVLNQKDAELDQKICGHIVALSRAYDHRLNPQEVQ